MFSRLSQFALLLKRREFWLELKRGNRIRIKTEMVEFIALPFPFPSKLKIWSFYVVVRAGTAPKCTKQRDARAELLFCSLNLLLFWRSPCRRRRSFVRSPIPRPRRRRKHHLKSEFAYFQSLSRFSQLAYFVKWKWTLFELRWIPKNHIQVQK